MKERIISQEITQELRQAYLDYAMSVIVSRALPDARDGLKPVQRRILYTMKELALWPQEKFTKCANIVGNVLARYHPHGDAPVYEALVRMAQDFSLRYPLVQGQGNFGSIDGDSPAQMRYTEAKMSPLAVEMLTDIDKETVDFKPNYDNTKKEPIVLPAKIPNLIINGSLGIAVGMATSIPPHNLFEVMSAIKFLIKNPQAEIKEILKIVKGPDFPTGGTIYGGKKLENIYEEGRGGIVLRGDIFIEKGKKERLIITSVPWQVNKSELIKEIANLALEKVLPEIKDVRDESNKEGIRIIIETKGGNLEKLKENLYRLTSLQKTFYFNLIALERGLQPKLFSLKELLFSWIDHRREVIKRRTKFDLERNKERVHLLEGFDKALENLDRVIETIKKSKDKKEALINLMKKFALSEKQAEAILEMPLRTLTQMERHKILEELKEKRALIKELEIILKSPKKIDEIIVKEADEVIEKYPRERKTKIIEEEPSLESPLVPEERVWLFIDQKNFVNLIPLDKFNWEKIFKEKNPPKMIWQPVSTQDKLILVSHKGKVYQVDLASFYERPGYLESQIILDKDDQIIKILFNNKKYLFLVFENGLGKKIKLEEVLSKKRTGVQVTKNIVKDALLLNGGETIGILTENGNLLLFKDNLPIQGKSAKGVKIIKKGHFKVNSVFLKTSDVLILIFDNGYYKKVDLKEIKVQNRGTKGVMIFSNLKYGHLLAVQTLNEEKEIILFDDKVKRLEIQKLPILKRTQVPKKIEGTDKIKEVIFV